MYCSDVSGAFDRVKLERLVAKLKKHKLHPQIVSVLTSWLQQRSARVVVGGKQSHLMRLQDMVYQDTVLGPTLWNLFFEDARRAINEVFFTEKVYADDLNAYREFTNDTSDESIFKCIDACQQELHLWGDANQVAFDASKESKHILKLHEPAGTEFKLLGVLFDDGLSMSTAVGQLVAEAGWKLRALLRTRRFYTDADLVVLYKSHLLSFLEYRTPAIYHATRDVLARLDAVQFRFLREAGISKEDALVHFHLAPLSVRRDIAMLGVIHRAVLGKGPAHFQKHFVLASQTMRKVVDPRASFKHPIIKRSVLGLVAVYNMLPASSVALNSVKEFQRALQHIVTERVKMGRGDWEDTFNPRASIAQHPLA